MTIKFSAIDYHVHLEGTVDYQLLHQLAKKNKISLTSPTFLKAQNKTLSAPLPNLLNGYFERGSFKDFVELYIKISSCIRSAEDLCLIIENYCQKAFLEGVVAAEMYVTPTTLVDGLALQEAELFEGLKTAEKLAFNKYQIALSWIFDIVRNSTLLEGDEPGARTLQYARTAQKAGANVVAIGVAGIEAGYPAVKFKKTLQQARADGFKILIHAGESCGPESIWDALLAGPPDRIGHGVSAFLDSRLVEELKERNIVLEVCPWSNISLGFYTIEDYPLAKLYQSGLNIAICSDDPGIFGKTLRDNYLLANQILGRTVTDK